MCRQTVKETPMPLSDNHNASPFNAVPPVAVLAALAMLAIEIVFTLAAQGIVGGPQGVGWRLAAVQDWGFSGPGAWASLVLRGDWSPSVLLRFVTYPFIHAGFTHMIFGAVILLALAKFCGEVLSGWRLAAVWLGSAVAGAVAYMLLVDTQYALIGGMPPDYGLVGAFTFLLWQRARATGGSPAMAFRMIGVLIALQLVFSLMQGGIGTQIVAELAGFVAGFGLAALLAPGGWGMVLAALRRR
jgi:membrane associated rhomboid family serine protease